MSTATCAAERSSPVKPGRDADGRFGKGNDGGPGNPFNRRLAAHRAAILNAADPEEVERVMRTMLAQALAGDLAAAKVILQYAVGKPQAAKESDLVDVDEFEVAKAKRAPYPRAMIALLDMPVENATEMAGDEPASELFSASDEMEEAEPKQAREDEVYRVVGHSQVHGEFPPDCPFAPLPDGADPTAIEEHERMLAEFGWALREGTQPSEPFAPLVDGAATWSEARNATVYLPS